jgi:gas vesicle protein
MRVLNFIYGVLIGAALGAILVLLTTPQSGQDIQSAAKEKFDKLVEEGRKASNARKAELEARMTNIRAGNG